MLVLKEKAIDYAWSSIPNKLGMQKIKQETAATPASVNDKIWFVLLAFKRLYAVSS